MYSEISRVVGVLYQRINHPGILAISYKVVKHLMAESNHQRIAGIDVDINGAIRCAIAIGQSVLPIDLHRTLKPHDIIPRGGLHCDEP